MNLLNRIKLRTKLGVLIGLAVLAVVAAICAGASTMHERMISDRIDKVRAVDLVASGFAQSLQDQVDAHKLTQEQAWATFRDEVHHIRFGASDDYLLIQNLDGVVVMHGGDPKREGKPTASRDAAGRSTGDLIRDALRTSDSGVIWYEAVKPGNGAPQAKVSYVLRFAPWGMVFIAGAWIDDVDAAFRGSLLALALIGGGILIATVLAAGLINRDIVGSLGGLQVAMVALAHGNTVDEIPSRNRKDEIGAMATSVQIFKDNMVETTRLRTGQETQKQQAEQDRRQAMLDLAASFEATIGTVLGHVGAAATELQSTAQAMAATSEATTQQAVTVAAVSEQATHHVGTVAFATDELSTTIADINFQVTQANEMIRNSVEQTIESTRQVQGLTAAADKIGSVVGIIRNIAGRTNLLALNAAIEAARAGDFGKGFAVVASEVKALANQTANATEEVAAQITAMQKAAQTSAGLIAGISEAIEHVHASVIAIVAAVEAQGTTTREISRHVVQAVQCTRDSSDNIGHVSRAAQHTGAAAAQVLASASELLQSGRTLNVQAGAFLAEIRAA